MATTVNTGTNANTGVNSNAYVAQFNSGQHEGGSQQTGYNFNEYTGQPLAFNYSSQEVPVVDTSGGYSVDGGSSWRGVSQPISGSSVTPQAQNDMVAAQRQQNAKSLLANESKNGGKNPVRHRTSGPAAGLEVTSKTASGIDTKEDGDVATVTKKATPVASVSVDDVYASKASTKPKPTKSGKIVDPEISEAVSDAIEEEVEQVKQRRRGRRGRPSNPRNPRSRIAKQQRRIDKEAGDGRRTTYVSPRDLYENIDAYGPRLKAMDRQRRERVSDRESDIESLANSLENWIEPEEGEESYHDYLARTADERELAQERSSIQAVENAIPNIVLGEEEWVQNQPLYVSEEDWDNEEKLIDTLVGYQEKRNEDVFDLLREGENPNDDTIYETVRKGEDKYWNKPEEEIHDKLREARDSIVRLLLNPILIRVEGEHVVTKQEKVGTKTRLKGHLAYSEKVNKRIVDIRNLYGNCSVADVFDLIILRGGIGVDLNQKIGGKDIGKFKLGESEIIELLNDIETSQRKYGHPFAIVDGKPYGNGVRDESGKFVVVAGTRCYPLGYCPAGLFKSLSKPGSVLYGTSYGEFQRMVGNEWKNNTYKEILSQTKGNAMWQARAIENMMRAVMSIDGIVDPSRLDIPYIAVNQSMMQMVAERAGEDKTIGRANEVRQERERKANEALLHRYQKANGRRKRNMVGDVARGVSSFQKACKVADVFLLITGPVEAMQSMLESNVAEAFMGKWTNSRLLKAGIDPNEYSVSERLGAVSTSREAVEARSVAETLFRIGGWTAVDAFLSDDNYKLTNADLRRFMNDYLITTPQKFGAKEGQEKGFIANARGMMDRLESVMLGSDLFKAAESKQFVKLAMNEMAQASLHERESFTTNDVEQWSERGGAEMVRSLLRTEAGREAFMCQGITSLGRKSPVSHTTRQIMSRNGVTEFAVRTFFDRFPEYGMNKIMRQIPYSNTLSYMASYGIDGLGKLFEVTGGGLETAGEALDRVGEYQAGRRLSFQEGLMKNIMYDTVMGANKLIIGCVYFAILQLLGGLHRPEKPEDRLNWNEWVIGDEEDSLPIRWAWFMDDLSGIGLPLGAALAVAQSGNWTNESKREAADVFLNAIAEFNDSTALFDAIKLFNNFDEELADALGNGETWLSPTMDERRQTSIELMAWKFLGDMTPTVVKQILPWSRDYLFREDYYARSASKVFDTPNYTMDEAKADYRTKAVTDYKEYEYRKMAQNNPLMAFILDLTRGAGFMSDNEDRSAKTGYMFTEQPIRTETADRYQSAFERFKVSPDELTNIKSDEAKAEFWRQHAEEVCQYITSSYGNSADAINDGFMLDPETRTACQEYCYWMINVKIPAQVEERKDEIRDQLGLAEGAYIPSEQYNSINEMAQSEKLRYRSFLDNYFENDDIPWRIPRYAVLDSDTVTRYLDDNGNAAVNPIMANGIFNAAREMLGLGQATAGTKEEQYLYGNIPNSLPLYSPNRLPVELTPLQRRAAEIGGRIPSMDPYPEMRGMEKFEPTMPDTFKKYYDPEQASSMLGFDTAPKKKPETTSTDTKTSKTYGSYGGSSRGYSRGGGSRSYSRGGGYYRSGGGGYSSSYNPKIYSTPRQVNGDRASGLSTRTPYKATTTYLRPGFYTKGSREAYRRQDI